MLILIYINIYNASKFVFYAQETNRSVHKMAKPDCACAILDHRQSCQDQPN